MYEGLTSAYVFPYYFLLPVGIRSNLSFVQNYERHYLKIFGVFHFSDIQCCVIFSVKMGYFWTFIPEFNLLPTKKPWYVTYRWIRNFKQIMNIKLSFSKIDMASFDYALNLKKSLGTSFLLYMLTPAFVNQHHNYWKQNE